MWFRKKEEAFRYEADWPEEYAYDEPMTEEEKERFSVFSAMQGRVRLILFSILAYAVFVTIGGLVTTYYPNGEKVKAAQHIGVAEWKDRADYNQVKTEVGVTQSLLADIGKLNDELVQTANNQGSFVPVQIGFNKMSDRLATQIRYTSTFGVSDMFQPFVQQLLKQQKDMQQFCQLMSVALVNQDSNALTQARSQMMQIQTESTQLQRNVNGLADTLQIPR